MSETKKFDVEKLGSLRRILAYTRDDASAVGLGLEAWIIDMAVVSLGDRLKDLGISDPDSIGQDPKDLPDRD